MNELDLHDFWLYWHLDHYYMALNGDKRFIADLRRFKQRHINAITAVARSGVLLAYRDKTGSGLFPSAFMSDIASGHTLALIEADIEQIKSAEGAYIALRNKWRLPLNAGSDLLAVLPYFKNKSARLYSTSKSGCLWGDSLGVGVQISNLPEFVINPFEYSFETACDKYFSQIKPLLKQAWAARIKELKKKGFSPRKKKPDPEGAVLLYRKAVLGESYEVIAEATYKDRLTVRDTVKRWALTLGVDLPDKPKITLHTTRKRGAL